MAPRARRRFAEFARSFGPAWIVMIAWKAAYWLCLILILAFGVIGVAAQL